MPCGAPTQARHQITFQAQACTHYYIRVGDNTPFASGNFLLTISPDPPAPRPTNDSWCSGLPPPIVPGSTFPFNTCGATTDNPPPEPVFNDIWYVYIPTCSGTVQIDTCGTPANFDTALAVYAGFCPAPPVAFNNNAGPASHCAGTLQSSVTFQAQAGIPYSIRVGSAVPGRYICGRLNIVEPNPPAQTCPPWCLPPCLSNPWQSRAFQVVGFANNTPWAWCLSKPCGCFNFNNLNVPGVPTSVPPNLALDQFRLASRFAESVRNACPARPPLSAKVLAQTIGPSGMFFIKARSCSATSSPNFVLTVGAQNTPCAAQCVVADVFGPDPLPTSGPCHFNPDIIELPLFGTDCNRNGDDDTIDVLLGFSADTNANGIPDECENPCEPVFTETFESHISGEAVCDLNGWEEWTGSTDVCAGVTTEQAFGGAQSLKIVGSAGGSTGQGDDTVRRFFGVTSGRWTFRTMTFVPANATGVGYLNLLSTYDDPPGSPVADFRWAAQVHFDADANAVLADFNAGSTTLIKGRWAEFRVEIDLDQDLADYFYDGARVVQNRSWSCGLGPPFCGTERRIEALDLYAGEPGMGGTSGMFFDDVSLRPACPPACVADVDDGSGTGTPDGGVTIDDLLYYLFIFEQGSIGADVDDGSGTGTPDGGVTIDDLLFYFFRFEQGC